MAHVSGETIRDVQEPKTRRYTDMRGTLGQYLQERQRRYSVNAHAMVVKLKL